MPSEQSNLVLCYNRGCGNKFDPNNNKEDSCTFHPGNPVFHDAYKGWSCCQKKCTDFTEFLNIKGCTKSFHSNIKPPETPKRVVDKSKADEVVVYKAPLLKCPGIKRPPSDTPLTKMKPEVASILKDQLENLVIQKKDNGESNEIEVGTNCKNGGCQATYEGPGSNEGTCVYHPGTAVFHEGLKFWSCCKKRTSDFGAFLAQLGCENGTHVWKKEKTNSTHTVCRYDWHQTGSHVIISVYAKKYDPFKSTVELNPVRAKIHIYFPEDDSCFDSDVELQGVIDVEKSQIGMLQTKIEIKMKKAEPGSWSQLEIVRHVEPEPEEKPSEATKKPEEKVENRTESSESDSVDLSDI